jgi:hypothetical protein
MPWIIATTCSTDMAVTSSATPAANASAALVGLDQCSAPRLIAKLATADMMDLTFFADSYPISARIFFTNPSNAAGVISRSINAPNLGSRCWFR